MRSTIIINSMQGVYARDTNEGGKMIKIVYELYRRINDIDQELMNEMWNHSQDQMMKMLQKIKLDLIDNIDCASIRCKDKFWPQWHVVPKITIDTSQDISWNPS